MPSATPSSSIPVLPLSEVDGYTFKFIGEGAANVVFEVLGQPGDDTSGTILQGEYYSTPPTLVRDRIRSLTQPQTVSCACRKQALRHTTMWSSKNTGRRP